MASLWVVISGSIGGHQSHRTSRGAG